LLISEAIKEGLDSLDGEDSTLCHRAICFENHMVVGIIEATKQVPALAIEESLADAPGEHARRQLT